MRERVKENGNSKIYIYTHTRVHKLQFEVNWVKFVTYGADVYFCETVCYTAS